MGNLGPIGHGVIEANVYQHSVAPETPKQKIMETDDYLLVMDLIDEDEQDNTLLERAEDNFVLKVYNKVTGLREEQGLTLAPLLHHVIENQLLLDTTRKRINDSNFLWQQRKDLSEQNEEES